MARISRFTIRTSDRRLFRRCLRKWAFKASLKDNMQRKGTEQNLNFWFGSGIHFALEDYHGYNRFGDPRRAFTAYYRAFDEGSLPDGASLMYNVGIGMLTYYIEWYAKKNHELQLQTLWLTDDMKEAEPYSEKAHPAVEQQFFLDLGMQVIVNAYTHKIIQEYKPEMENLEFGQWPKIRRQTNPDAFFREFVPGCEEKEETLYYQATPDSEWTQIYLTPIHYHGTIDRIVKDQYGRWWLVDYKTAKSADTEKLDTDDQISAYLWAAAQWFQHPIYGFIYIQLTKDVARPMKRLKNGELSTDKKQKTTYTLAKQCLLDEFGSMKSVPNKYIEFLNTLAEKEGPEGDRFIRWDFVQRSKEQIIATYNHIMGEVRLMVNPSLYLYPNPTRDCSWDCDIRDICLALDAGRKEDVRLIIDHNFEPRPRGEENQEPEWREKIQWPDTPLDLANESEFAEVFDKLFDVVLPSEYTKNVDETF